MKSLTMWVAHDGGAVASWQDLFMVAMRPAETPSFLDEIERSINAYAAEQQGLFGYMAIIEQGVRVPTRATTQHLEEILFKHVERCRYAAIIVEDKGFKGSVIRSLSRMIGIMSNKRHPENFFETTDEAIDWICAISTGSDSTSSDFPVLTRASLAVVINAFRAEYRKKGARYE